MRLARFTLALGRMSRDYPLWYVNDYGVPALLMARLRRASVVMKIVGDFAWEYSRRNGLTADGIDAFQTRRYAGRIAMLKRLQRTYVRGASRVIVPSRYLAGLVEGWGVPAHRIRVIYNAVSLDGLRRLPVERPGPGPLLLTAGRLASWKGMDHLLEIFARVRARMPQVHLAIAGDGPMKDRLEAHAARLDLVGSVSWLGGLSREALVSWMKEATAFVLLSEYEGFPHVALEAMSSGLPVVLSPAGGNPELITDGRGGLLVEPADHAAGATVLADLLADQPRLSELSARGRARAADFTWERLVDQTMEVFAEAASRPVPRG